MKKTLASYAASDKNSRGRIHPEKSPAHRSEFQRDRDRVIHSAAFRRLEYKTQVFVNHEGDLYRTRLTHSIEVAQIARSIARAMRLNEDLTESIALAHDLGHTPFGHAGQDALNACMHDYGGFEHNLQSLRVVDELEEKYADFSGLNLTFESREGVLKHCSNTNAKKLGAIGKRFIKKQNPSLEAQLVNLADEIAYNSHDVDDGLRAGLITMSQLNEVVLFEKQYNKVISKYPDLGQRKVIHEIVRRLINAQVVDLIENSMSLIKESDVKDIEEVRKFKSPLIQYTDKMREQNLELKQFLRKNLYTHYKVLRMSTKADTVIKEMFSLFFHHPELLPEEFGASAKACMHEQDAIGCARVVADYIAGMTDRYAIEEHAKLFNPSHSS